MILETIVVGPIQANCYLYGDEKTGEICVIDPGADADRILRRIAEKGYSIKQVLLTHGHFDHIGALRDILEKTGVTFCIGKDEAALFGEHLATYLREDPASLEDAMRLLEDGDALPVGGLSLRVLHTPGHTAGGVCYRGEGILFSGDTIFYENIGRTDLPTGSYPTLIDSVNRVLTALPGDTVICPGHGEKTTAAHEQKQNPYFSGGDIL